MIRRAIFSCRLSLDYRSSFDSWSVQGSRLLDSMGPRNSSETIVGQFLRNDHHTRSSRLILMLIEVCG